VEDQDVLNLAREAAERLIELDATLERWPLIPTELEYRYRRLMGGTILT
jgi:ATP-dependent DNA helicase RecG